MIPPVDAPDEPKGSSNGRGEGGGHFVACLFTSRHYGRKRDSPEQILAATGPAMGDLLARVGEWNRSCDNDPQQQRRRRRRRIGEVWMCKINSGMFGVPWERTKEVLEGVEVGGSGVDVVKVVSPAG